MMKDDLEFLYQKIIQENGILYICGSEKMGKQVLNIVEDIFKTYLNVPPYNAYKKVTELEKNHKIYKELWG